MQAPIENTADQVEVDSRSRVELPIYLDNHATTPVDGRVLEAMLPYFNKKFGNPASRSHSFGWEADAAVETARTQVAKLIGAASEEIVFTSGATESNNLAIKGIADSYRAKGNHIITVATEHKAVLDSCKRLEERGYLISYLDVSNDGLIDLEKLKCTITDKTILVSIMYANNEIGVLQPIKEIGHLCRCRGVIFHSDAVQAVGKIPINVNNENIDLLSLTAHKFYGPKGVGALYVRRKAGKLQLTAQIDGGGHEMSMRSGTLNVAGIVGLGKACELAVSEMAEEAERIRLLRNKLKGKLEIALDGIHVNGSMEHRLPGNLNMSFAGIDGENLLAQLDDIALSRGSACRALEPSYVLTELGLSDELARSSVRFGLGRFTTDAEIDYVAEELIRSVRKLRGWRARLLNLFSVGIA